MKRMILFILLLFQLWTIPTHAAPTISAWAACVMDGQTGRLLFEKNADALTGMASTTKIMTAIIALESGNLNDIVTVSKNAADTEGSSIWLDTGEHLSLSDLLYGLLLASGNDAAVAIAEHIAGDVPHFVEQMNEKAIQIGAIHTHFDNPNGLPADTHQTTAYDLALMTRYAMQNPDFREIVSTKEKTISWEGSEWKRTLHNHNKLLTLYPDCDGVKTGFTKKDGRCLVTSATREGKQLIAVTLSDPNDWDDHVVMLNEAFREYPVQTVVEASQPILYQTVKNGRTDKVLISAGKGVTARVKDSEISEVHISYDWSEELTAPVHKGDLAGMANVCLGEYELGSFPLLADGDVPKEKFPVRFWKHFTELLTEMIT